MKRKITKFLSMLIVFVLVVSSLGSAFSVSAATVADYYIKNGGTGNGKTAATPAADLDTVIKQINADGLTAGDIANVYVMQDATCNTAGNAHGMAYMMATPGVLTTHTAEIVVQSYGDATNYLTFSNTMNTQQVITLTGNMAFKNVKIVAPKSNSYLNLNAGNIKFLQGTTYGYATGATTPISVSDYNKLPVPIAHTQASGITYNQDANIVIESAFNDNLVLSTYLPNRPIAYQKDLNIVMDNADIAANITWGSSNAYSAVTVAGNLNLNLKAANTIANVAGAAKLTVSGGIHIINSGANVSGDVSTFTNVTTTKGIWVLNNNSGNKNLLTPSATAGTFIVNTNQKVIATDGNDNKFYSKDGKLVLDAGEYDIGISAGPVVKNYYIINGGTGNGSSPESPLATVADAINAANAEALTSEDTINIFVMQKSDCATITNGVHGMTVMGGSMPEHTAKVVIQSYGDTALYLCSDSQIAQTNFLLTGDVEFKNINLVLAKNNALFYCGGNNVKFNQDVSIMYASNNNGKVNVATAGSSSNLSISAFANSLSFDKNANIIINNKVTTPITLSALIASRNQTFQKDVNVVIDNANISTKVNWAACSTTVNGNFNFMLNNAASITNQAGSGKLKINGGLQVIVNFNASYSGNPLEFTNVTATKGKWLITNNSAANDIISCTDVAGVFAVKEGKNILAYTEDGSVVEPDGGLLKLDPGSYSIKEIDEVMPYETMLYILEPKINGNDVFVQEMQTLEPEVEYTVSFDYKFLSGALNKTLYFGIYSGSDQKESGYIYNKELKSSMNQNNAFGKVVDDGKSVKYTFSLTKEEIGTDNKFFGGFYFTSQPTLITELCVRNLRIYKSSDNEKTNLFNDDNKAGTVYNWYSKNGKSQNGYSVFSRTDSEFTAQYVEQNKTLFESETVDMRHGDANADGVLDLRDLVEVNSIFENGGCFPLADTDKNSVIDASDVATIRRYILGLENVPEWEPYKMVLAEPNVYYGGADDQYNQLKNDISINEDSIESSQKTYYISVNGEFSNDGESSGTPTTIVKLKTLSLNAGDTVLFERGGVYRIDTALQLVSGINYGAYGTGDKPIISGSVKNYANPNLWSSTDGYIWTLSLSDSVGHIIYDNGKNLGIKKASLDLLLCDGDYYQDVQKGILYLYLTQRNPGSCFKNIEISTTSNLVLLNDAQNVNIENITFKHSAADAMILSGSANINVCGCEFLWIGGSYNGGSSNAIKLTNTANNCSINKNLFSQVFNSAISFGKNSAESYEDLTIESNIIEYCAVGLEFGAGKDISFDSNILRFAGAGFGSVQREDVENQAFVASWNYAYTSSQISNFNITNNVFDSSRANIFYVPTTKNLIAFEGNEYYQQAGNYLPDVNEAKIYSTDKNTFETAIGVVDKTPKAVKWLSEMNVKLRSIEKIARIGWRVYNNGTPPEQSLASFKAAYEQGYKILLCDVRLTADNQIVCLHDETINSVARNKDGSAISETIYISDITLGQANQYDFGIKKGTQYKGTTILRLEEFIELCEELGCTPHLEFKVYPNEEICDYIIDLLKEHGFERNVMFNGTNTETMQYIANKLPNAVMGRWVGAITDALIEQIALYGDKNDKFIYVSNGFESSITEENYIKCLEKGIDIGYSEIRSTDELKSVTEAGFLKYCKFVATRYTDLTTYFVELDGDFENNGSEINVLGNTQIDLATVEHTEYEGKEFIGWFNTTKGTAALKIDTYKAGDKLVAQYVDVAEEDNYVGAVQTLEATNGLEFVVNESKSLDSGLPTVVERGTIFADADATYCADIYFDANVVCSWDKQTLAPITLEYKPTQYVSNNISNETDKYLQYKFSINNLAADDYNRYYSVRGYIKYLDMNGIERILYTTQVQGSLYKVAAEKDDSQRTLFDEEIIDYCTGDDVKQAYDAKYPKQKYDENYKLIDGVFEFPNQNAITYRQNNLWVKEISVNTGFGIEKTEIAFLADTHLNYINQQDVNDAVSNTLNTYKSRTMCEGVAGYEKVTNIMGFANMFEKIIFGGDVFDYYSKGNLAMTRRLFTERNVNNKITMTLGNHEYMETMNGSAPVYSLDYKYQQIQKNWTNDINYSSEIMKNANGGSKLMLITLNNGNHQYLDSQVVSLENDLDYAKKNNIPVLIFQHVPMLTMNPKETAYPILDAAGDWHGLWDMAAKFATDDNYTVKRDMTSFSGYIGLEYDGIGNEKNNATNKVVKLIRQNYSIIKGVFAAHEHANMYTEIVGLDSNGNPVDDAYIPQHSTYAGYNNGVTKIVVG